MLNVGLTGGIACGKSTVARMLEARGAVLIDFDELAHLVIEPGQPAWEGIVRHFGKGILLNDGRIDRGKLGDIVFADPRQRESLNAIVHPAVFTEWQRRLDRIEQEQRDAIVISDIPLLIEAGLKGRVDLVLLVHVSAEEQLRRLMARNGLGREEALLRIASQMPMADKIPHADLIIENDGSLEETGRQADRVWAALLARRGPAGP